MEQNKEKISQNQNDYHKKGGLYANIKMPLKTANFLVLSAAGALAVCLFGAILLS
ncbi:MAG: hypothetical protein ACLUH5_08195 [Eubacterium sp.]|uniref:hypothetical protein n=1 Tax=Eubacterium sp. TaxID=142586 RepID=UPI003A303C4C